MPFIDLHHSLRRFSISDSQKDFHTNMNEVIYPSDSHASSICMIDAKHKEIKGLRERKTFKIILLEDVPSDASVLPGKFLLAIKSTNDGWNKFKTLYVIGCHSDRLKKLMGKAPSRYITNPFIVS